jgi:hypothetical protein
MEMIMKGVLVAVILLAWPAGPAYAETYRWTEEGGVVHFADNFAKIPSRYQQKATVESDRSSVNIMPASGAAERAAAEPGAGAKGEAKDSKKETGTKKLKTGKKSSHSKPGKKKSKQVVKAPSVATTPARRAQNQAEERMRNDRQTIDDAQLPARRAQDQAEEQIRKARDGMAGH